jgi:hypothetical protein
MCRHRRLPGGTRHGGEAPPSTFTGEHTTGREETGREKKGGDRWSLPRAELGRGEARGGAGGFRARTQRRHQTRREWGSGAARSWGQHGAVAAALRSVLGHERARGVELGAVYE